MANYPWFYFFPSDWLGSNNRACMSLEQQGAYINLLCRQWAEPTCSLPDDDEVLAGLSEMGEGWLKGGSLLVRKCFPPHPDLEARIANPKLLELRAERDEWIEKSREGGRKSAAARKKGRRNGGSTTVPTTTPTKRQPKGNLPFPFPYSDEVPNGTSSSRTKLRFDDADLETAKWMYGLIHQLNPDSPEPNYGNWANTIRLIREKDGHTNQEIRELFQLANQDEFWGPNILSPSKLREQWKKGLALKLKGGSAPRRPQRPDGRVYE